jgi:Fe-Mn family superoxide dismutase
MESTLEETMTETEEYELPDLAYDYGGLEPVYSRELLELHHDTHHAAYVRGANAALASLVEVRKIGDYGTINQLQKDLAFNLSGHILHSIFWRNMSPDGGGAPGGRLAKTIASAFGGSDALRTQLSQAATSIQGSGWGALCYEPASGKLIVEQIYDHQGNFGIASVPLLVLDMWEHAYYLQYKSEKRKWVDRFWDVVDWQDVAARLDTVEPLDLRLGS